MTKPPKKISRLSSVILMLGTAGGIAMVAMAALPERITWSDDGMSRLFDNVATLTAKAEGMLPAALGRASVAEQPLIPESEPVIALAPQFGEHKARELELEKAVVSSVVAAGLKPEPQPKLEADIEPERNAAGVIRSQDQATLASRMTALITAMPLEAGQTFKRGETLIAFDCLQLNAQLKAADAAVVAYKTTYDTNVELDQYKAIGTNELRVSRANVNKAAAEADALRATTTQCRIDAPFDGAVVERKANPHDVAASGQPLLLIQSDGKLEVELIVPSSWLVWIGPGNHFSFRLEETGKVVEGKVVRLGATVDPVSKTVRVIGEIDSNGRVMPGMSGVAHFDAPTPSAQNSKDSYVKRI